MARHAISIDGDTGRLKLPARFDIMSTIELRIPFSRLLSEPRVRRLALDFSNLGYIDSIGIGTLLAWSKSCQEYGKAMVLEKCDRKIANAFRLVGVNRQFVFAPDAA